MANPESHHGISDVGYVIMRIVVWFMCLFTTAGTVMAIKAGIPFWLPIAGLIVVLSIWCFLWWLWDLLFKKEDKDSETGK